MITPVTEERRLGGPSSTHERRAGQLQTLAILSGYVEQIDALPDGSRPDVFQVRPSDRSIFLGDAKHTETPGILATRMRLSHYSDFLQRYVAAGGSGVMALIVPERDAYEWLRLLRELALGGTRKGARGGHVDVLERGTALVWETIEPLLAV